MEPYSLKAFLSIITRRPTSDTLLKTLDISSTTAMVAPEMLKALAILSNTTFRRSQLIEKN